MANPTIAVDATPFTANSYVKITWTNAAKGGSNWYSWRVYRRLADSGEKWQLLKEFLYDISDYEYHDYSAGCNNTYEYIVVRVYLSSGVPTEELKDVVVEAETISDEYWLIHPSNALYNALLYRVKSDSFGHEMDIGEMNIIGRGRRVDRSTNWGVRGSLGCSIRNQTGMTPRQQMKVLESQMNQQSYFWFKNPFGDVLKVAVSNFKVDRVPGVGIQEYTDVSFDYAEVVG